MNNPFEMIDVRLSTIESLLIGLKHGLPTPPPIDDPQQFTITELAAYLKCTKQTVHAYKRKNIFPYYQTGRTIYFKRAEVDTALEVGKKKGLKNG